MRPRRGLPLPLIFEGIDRDQSRALEKLKSALDLITENGRLVRRPAWQSIAAGPVLHRPPGQVSVVSNGALASGRVLSSSGVGSDGWIYVGADSPFDGIEWGDITAGDTTAGANRRLSIQFSDGAGGWTASSRLLLDSTDTHIANRTGHVPLLRNGRLHFRAPSAWASEALVTLTRYWVRFRIVSISDSQVTTPTMTGISWTMAQPGVRVFDRAPINGLRAGNIVGAYGAVICADQPARHLFEPGANIGLWRFANDSTRELRLTERTTSGFWGQVPHESAALYTDSPRPTTTSGETGTSGRFTDRGVTGGADGFTAQGYNIFRLNAAIFEEVAPSATGTTTSFTTTNAGIIALPNNSLEHHIIQVTTAGGGPTLGLVRMITGFTVSGGVATITLSPALDAAPTTSTRFAIGHPHTKVRAKSAGGAVVEADALSGTATTILIDTADYSEQPTNRFGANAHVHFEVQSSPRWNVRGGKRYSIVPDPLDGSLILANGEGPPLRWDGLQLTRLATAREDDPRVEAVLGTLPALGPNPRNDPRTLAYEAMFYRQPPAGKYWTVHNGAFFVAGLTGESDAAQMRIQWSMPGTRRDLWPRAITNEAAIRDSTGCPIRGITSYYDRVIAFTESSIHEGAPIPNGGYNFRQLAGSIGFTSHFAVGRVPLNGQDVLIGPSPQGLAAFSGGQPIYLIDRWDRVVEGGVNPGDLIDAPGAVWPQKGYYLLRLSSTRMLVYDYVNTRAWVWSMPFGIASIHVTTNTVGKELLLVGTDDGMIATLTGTYSDDNSSVVPAALETHPLPLSRDGSEVRIARVTAEVAMPGEPHTMDVSLYRDEENEAFATGTFPVYAGEAEFGTDSYGTATYATNRSLKIPANVPRGTKCRAVALAFEVAAECEIKSLAVEFDVLTQGR